MLKIDLTIADFDGEHNAAYITVARGGQHHRLPRAYYYDYRVHIDTGEYYKGVVLHSYDNGVVALVAKVTRHIVRQQRAAKYDRQSKIRNNSN